MDKKFKKLTKEQYRVLKEGHTEMPFTGKLLHNKEKGTYNCGACGKKLFSSKEKYDSGTGWPSFTNAKKGSVKFKEDKRLFVKRIEVICSNCKSHLGHVFDDGPKGKRFCINSLALKFEKN